MDVRTRSRLTWTTTLTGRLILALAAVVLVVNLAHAHGATAGADQLTNIQLVGASTTAASNGAFQILDGGGVSGLSPGAVKPLQLSVTNPYNFDIRVTALTVTLTVNATTGKAGCANTTQNLQPGTYTGPSFVVKANRTVTALATIPITMPATTANACQGAAFPLTYGGTATKVTT